MFEPQDDPRVFGLAPGVDFPKELVGGLLSRLLGQPTPSGASIWW